VLFGQLKYVERRVTSPSGHDASLQCTRVTSQ
jgi:hypothetical protein